jgi:hypothetical protein
MKIKIHKLSYVVIIVLIAIISVAMTVSTAHADGIIYWDGQEEKILPCPYGARWSMTPGDGIDSANLYVDGTPFPMTRSADDEWRADSTNSIHAGVSVYAEYIGSGGYDYHIELLFCLMQDATPTYTPVTPTDSPTPTNTLLPPTSTPTNTPTSTPSYTPTHTQSSPTPTTTDHPNDPTATLTQTLPPMPTPTNTPTQTSTAIPATATRTPFPPIPAVATEIQSSFYPGENLGNITMGGTTYQLFLGMNASDGSLLLPSNILGAAFYQNTIWVHRLWRIGYLNINQGDLIAISTAEGEVRTYEVMSSTYIKYGIYPQSLSTDEPYQYIATCYSDDRGEWIGVQLYKLNLVDIHLEGAK